MTGYAHDNNFMLPLLLLVIGLVFVLIIFPAWRRHQKFLQTVREERDQLLSAPVPQEIRRAIASYVGGQFDGAEESPLAYVGYRVGKARGLPRLKRIVCLNYCFRMEIPCDLPAKYQRWGRPASLMRFRKMIGHLNMLADQRCGRIGYEFAVGDWDNDRRWFASQYSELAQRLGRAGYRA